MAPWFVQTDRDQIRYAVRHHDVEAFRASRQGRTATQMTLKEAARMREVYSLEYHFVNWTPSSRRRSRYSHRSRRSRRSHRSQHEHHEHHEHHEQHEQHEHHEYHEHHEQHEQHEHHEYHEHHEQHEQHEHHEYHEHHEQHSNQSDNANSSQASQSSNSELCLLDSVSESSGLGDHVNSSPRAANDAVFVDLTEPTSVVSSPAVQTIKQEETASQIHLDSEDGTGSQVQAEHGSNTCSLFPADQDNNTASLFQADHDNNTASHIQTNQDNNTASHIQTNQDNNTASHIQTNQDNNTASHIQTNQDNNTDSHVQAVQGTEAAPQTHIVPQVHSSQAYTIAPLSQTEVFPQRHIVPQARPWNDGPETSFDTMMHANMMQAAYQAQQASALLPAWVMSLTLPLYAEGAHCYDSYFKDAVLAMGGETLPAHVEDPQRAKEAADEIQTKRNVLMKQLFDALFIVAKFRLVEEKEQVATFGERPRPRLMDVPDLPNMTALQFSNYCRSRVASVAVVHKTSAPSEDDLVRTTMDEMVGKWLVKGSDLMRDSSTSSGGERTGLKEFNVFDSETRMVVVAVSDLGIEICTGKVKFKHVIAGHGSDIEVEEMGFGIKGEDVIRGVLAWLKGEEWGQVLARLEAARE